MNRSVVALLTTTLLGAPAALAQRPGIHDVSENVPCAAFERISDVERCEFDYLSAHMPQSISPLDLPAERNPEFERQRARERDELERRLRQEAVKTISYVRVEGTVLDESRTDEEYAFSVRAGDRVLLFTCDQRNRYMLDAVVKPGIALTYQLHGERKNYLGKPIDLQTAYYGYASELCKLPTAVDGLPINPKK